MHIFVSKLDGARVALNVEPSDKVMDVKLKIEDEWGHRPGYPPGRGGGRGQSARGLQVGKGDFDPIDPVRLRQAISSSVSIRFAF